MIDKVREEMQNLNWGKIFPYLKHVGMGSMKDINDGHAEYYKFLPALMNVVKPKQVVELGSAAGTSALMMLSCLPQDSHLYACSIPEIDGEFRFIKDRHSNLTMIRGDDLDMRIWKDVDLGKTDVWFIDTDHNFAQVNAELELYSPYFKKGAIVLMDDINLNEEMRTVWDEIEYEKHELNDLHTYERTGFGMFIV